MKQTVSAPVAALVIFLAAVAFAAVFHNARLAPPEQAPIAMPPEPPVNDREVVNARQGLKPLGLVAVLPPLMEDRRQGVRVAGVLPGSPADRAGIKVGDRIDSFDQHRVAHPMALARAITQVKPDQVSEIVVLRAGKDLTLKVTGIHALPPEERPHY